MKINKVRLKFARENRYIKEVFDVLFETLDPLKLKRNGSMYIYDDKIKLDYWVGTLYEPGFHFELSINGEHFDSDVIVGWFNSCNRNKDFSDYYK